MRGCKVRLATFLNFVFFLGASLGPLVVIFGICAKNAAEPWGRELLGPSVGPGRVPEALVAFFGISAENAAQPWGLELRGSTVGPVPVHPGRSKLG